MKYELNVIFPQNSPFGIQQTYSIEFSIGWSTSETIFIEYEELFYKKINFHL